MATRGGPAQTREVVPGFGAAVRAARGRRGLSQRQLAALAGTGQPYVSRVEREDVGPSLRLAVALAAALGVTVGELLGEARG